MKILIISDSHGLQEELGVIKEAHRDDIDLMIHCGDSELPFNHESLKGFVVVKGNCDFDNNFPNEVEQEVNGYKLLATHGHLFHVKNSLMTLSYRADEIGAQIVCFGHSHIAGSERIADKLFINPGSISMPRGRKDPTYCILEVYKKELHVVFYNKDHTELKDLSQKYSM
ncbi:putative phosphoesterase [Bacillus mesophilus]|uniref:Phosphoesterase n=1 Tax=Bacillus mesophilus TaxID=1808955 RepID=A0A6M0Q672_9BACI|nr:metallophosphoesterase [Bacillus mesophilus]MBM7660630.1 putative phosphoesterase [Bacillus mesophilus]NEY71822.1 metallophosphoesterase [Bacillus mesophilus]